MTRELLLELHDGVYCEKIQRESQGDLVDYYRKTLCAAFVKLLVSGEPERVRVVLTDKQALGEGFTEIKVLRVGHYRWWYCLEGTFFNNTYGMYRAVEDILMSIYPLDFDEKDKDGKWKAVVFISGEAAPAEEHSLWIRIESYEEVCNRH
jgi:hypothetical protein